MRTHRRLSILQFLLAYKVPNNKNNRTDRSLAIQFDVKTNGCERLRHQSSLFLPLNLQPCVKHFLVRLAQNRVILSAK